MSFSWKLYLDDQYDDPNTPLRRAPAGFEAAHSSKEAIALTIAKGVPCFISFDHDLGENDDATAYIHWLIEHHYNALIPQYQIHSANPIGAMNIRSLMESWKKSLE